MTPEAGQALRPLTSSLSRLWITLLLPPGLRAPDRAGLSCPPHNLARHGPGPTGLLLTPAGSASRTHLHLEKLLQLPICCCMHSELGWSRWSVVVRPWTWTGVIGAVLGTGWTQLGQTGLAGGWMRWGEGHGFGRNGGVNVHWRSPSHRL